MIRVTQLLEQLEIVVTRTPNVTELIYSLVIVFHSLLFICTSPLCTIKTEETVTQSETTINVSCQIKQPKKENKTFTAISMLLDVSPIYLGNHFDNKEQETQYDSKTCLFENNNL